MINTTLNEILKHKPEEGLRRKLLKHLGKTHFRKTKADDEPLPLVKILAINGLSDAIWCLRTLSTDTFHNALTYTQGCASASMYRRN